MEIQADTDIIKETKDFIETLYNLSTQDYSTTTKREEIQAQIQYIITKLNDLTQNYKSLGHKWQIELNDPSQKQIINPNESQSKPDDNHSTINDQHQNNQLDKEAYEEKKTVKESPQIIIIEELTQLHMSLSNLYQKIQSDQEEHKRSENGVTQQHQNNKQTNQESSIQCQKQQQYLQQPLNDCTNNDDLKLIIEELQKLNLEFEHKFSNFNLGEEGLRASVPSIHDSLKFTLLDKPHEISQYKDENEHYFISQLENGNFIIGGNYPFLIKLNSDLKYIQKIEISGIEKIYRGMVFGHDLYCWTGNEKLTIIDLNTQKIVKEFFQKYNNVWAFKKFNDDYVLVGEGGGAIKLIEASTHDVLSGYDNFDDVNAIVPVTHDKVAIGTNHGLKFVQFTFADNKVEFKELDKITYSDHSCYINAFEMINDHQYIAGESQQKYLLLIDATTKTCRYLDELGEFNGSYAAIQKIPGYDYQRFPYLIVKDTENVSIVNVQTYQVHSRIACSLGNNHAFNYSLITVQTKKELQLIVLYHQNNKAMVKKFKIGNIKNIK